MPTSKYDKYYIDEMVKKFPKQDDIDGIFERVKGFSDDTFESQFQEVVDEFMTKKNKNKMTTPQKIAEEVKQATVVNDKKWTDDDLTDF